MEPIEFPQDFSEFLRLLNDHRVEYLLVGGFAVALHGYPRATADLFESPDRVVRMGVAPLRIEILTDIDGVAFADCAGRAENHVVDGTPIRIISLPDLKRNKKASGRPKDLDDLEHLP